MFLCQIFQVPVIIEKRNLSKQTFSNRKWDIDINTAVHTSYLWTWIRVICFSRYTSLFR